LIYGGDIYFLLAIIPVLAFVPMTLFLSSAHSIERQLTGDIGKTLLGPVYVCFPLSMLIMMDRYPQGNIWIFFLLAVIFASDTGAFYFGRLFGKHKLYEAISPGKTWEGAIGGVISSVIVALWFLHILLPHRIDTGILAIVMVLSVIGQIGDLTESMLKRSCGVKDSSRILPGHGGILDRIDGLLFAIPVFYMYLRFKI
jgi:phosphatidate cytidylyltransferase